MASLRESDWEPPSPMVDIWIAGRWTVWWVVGWQVRDRRQFESWASRQLWITGIRHDATLVDVRLSSEACGLFQTETGVFYI